MIHEAEDKVEHINKMYHRGMLNEEGRYKAVIAIWNETTDAITEELDALVAMDRGALQRMREDRFLGIGAGVERKTK